MMSMGASPLRYPRRRRSTQADGHGHRRRRCAIHPVAALLLVVGATNDRGGRQNRSGIWRALPCVRVEAASAAASRPSGRPNVLVVGSMNLDTILSVDRLPVEGENLTVLRDSHPTCDVPGGKGCNQAIAASRLMREEKDDDEGEKKDGRGGGETKTKPVGRSVSFVGQFGCDASGAKILRRALLADGVDVSGCGQCRDAPCGRGYVFLVARTGSVSAVVSGGSNVEGWWSPPNERGECDVGGEWARRMRKLVRSRSVVMLQREIPEHVNLCVARAAAAAREEKGGGRPIVMQDVGGEDRPMSSEMMSLCDYLVPNRSELARLVRYFSDDDDERGADEHDDEDEDVDDARIVEWCRLLQDRGGANHVLVTLGSRGSILVPPRSDSSILRQPPCPLPDGTAVVDETCAGDCYRAALAVGLSEGMTARRAMEFASAAGAVAVTRVGAAPSIPTRGEVDDLRRRHFGEDGVAEGGAGGVVDGNVAATSPGATSVRGGGEGGGDDDLNATGGDDDDEECPLMFGSRLNSMKDRPDLWDGPPLDDPRMWVKRQGTIRGLGCVDFNYPQHFHGWTNAEAKQALDEAGLVAGAVCLRYPHHRFQLGAMTHPDPAVRREAIDLTKQAAQTALDLGCSEVVVWSAYDGYDYPFQVDYDDKWGQIVDAFRECCDAFPDVKFSLEYKPTDENTRFFAVPSTGAAVLLVREVDRPNMGLTLDVGHMLMSGENPAQSIAMAGSKLFGVQLNDGYTRLAAEDGMMFGSVHPNMALEAIYHLQRIKYRGHLYFDTFPQRTDPVREAEYNIRKVKEFWRAARRLDGLGIRDVMASHDALGALERTEDAFAFALARDGGGRGGNED